MKVELEEIIKYLKENYRSVDIHKTYYLANGDYSDTIHLAICKIKFSPDIKYEYHKCYSSTVDELCKDLEDKFKK